MTVVDTLAADNVQLMNDIEDLMQAQDEVDASALIEDYFNVNDGAIAVPAATNFALVDGFCIAGPSVFKFELSASFREEEERKDNLEVMVVLMIDGQPVAQADVEDAEDPSSLSLIYRGRIAGPTDVMVIAISPSVAIEIADKELQWGYKLYNDGYNLTNTLDTACLALA